MNIKIYDFNICKNNDRNGTYGGQAGSKEGILFNGENWIVKYPKSTKGMRNIDDSYTTSPLSEFIGSHVYEILGYDVHHTLLGIRNNKLVVACKDFCESEGELREIRTIKNVYNERLSNILEEHFSSTGSDHFVNLEELLIHFENNPLLKDIPGLKERFWECVVIDGLINNNDRNNGNWGLLYKNGNYKLAPIFDNGAAFYNKLSDQQLEKRLQNRPAMEDSFLKVQTIYSIEDKQLSLKEMLELDNPDLKKAVLKVTPLIEDKFIEIKDFIYSIPTEYMNIPVMSDTRKLYYIQSMDMRLSKTLNYAFEKLQKNHVNILDNEPVKVADKECFKLIEDDLDDREI